MLEGVSGVVRGFRLLLAALGAYTTLQAVISESVVVAINTAGVVGLGGLVIGGMVYFGDVPPKEDVAARVQHLKVTLITLVVVTAITGLVFLAGRPLDEDESAFSFLTLVGVLVLLFYAYVASLGAETFLKEPRKRCPDCANEVLAAARKCQHCGHRFVDA